MDSFVSEAELHELNMLILCKLQLVTGFRHLFAFVNLGHLYPIKVIGHSDTLHEAVPHEDLYLIQVEIRSFHKEQGVIERLFSIFLQLVLCNESLRSLRL